MFLKAFNLFYETTEIYLNSQHIGNIIFVIYCSSTKVYEIIGANLGSSVSKATRQAGYVRMPWHMLGFMHEPDEPKSLSYWEEMDPKA